MNTKLCKALIIAVVATAIFGCKSDDYEDAHSSRNSQSDRRNSKDYTIWEFVHSSSYYYYYWNSNVPENVDYSNYDSPAALFESFKDSDDRFSLVTNNYTELTGALDNHYETDGINYQVYYDNSYSNDVIAVIEYVYDNSPAKKGGLKRGMVIHEVDGKQLTADNYSELLNQSTCTYTYSNLYTVDNGDTPQIMHDGPRYNSPSITKEVLDINPVLKVSTFERNGKRIGYLLYDSFTSSTKEIIDAIETLSAQQITDLVIDLRLNGGGYVSTLDTLASMIVPDGHAGDLFIQSEYNDILSQYFRRLDGNDYNKDYFVATDNLPSLNINNLYVLTSYGTASASEELISGLMPYMNVITIGSTTYGKFTSNILLNDTEDVGSDSDGIAYSEWAVYLCIAVCKNANGEMNFKNGFSPNYSVKDTYTYQLGDEDEPLLAKALELASGTIAKSTKIQPNGLDAYVGQFGKPTIKYGAFIK